VLTVLSPAQAIEALMAHVQSAGLDKNADKPLLSQLAVVLKSVLNGRPATAILQLQAFIDYVQAQAAKSIEGTDAAALIAAARQIIAALQISS
jgi:hypothetical protein